MPTKILWVKTEGSPWWPAKVTACSAPDGFDTTVQFYGSDGASGYILLRDRSSVRPFNEVPEGSPDETDAALMNAFREAKKEWMASRCDAAKKRPFPDKVTLSDRTLCEMKNELSFATSDEEALLILRRLVNVNVDLDQLFRTKIAVAVSKLHRGEHDQRVKTVATGLLQYWFSCLDDDSRHRLLSQA